MSPMVIWQRIEIIDLKMSTKRSYASDRTARRPTLTHNRPGRPPLSDARAAVVRFHPLCHASIDRVRRYAAPLLRSPVVTALQAGPLARGRLTHCWGIGPPRAERRQRSGGERTMVESG